MEPSETQLRAKTSFEAIYASLNAIRSTFNFNAQNITERDNPLNGYARHGINSSLNKAQEEVASLENLWQEVHSNSVHMDEMMKSLRMQEHHLLVEKSRTVAERSRLDEQLSHLQAEQTKLHENLSLITSKEEDLSKRELQLARDIERLKVENTEALSKSTKDYVQTTMTDLRTKEDSFLKWSKSWGIGGALLLVLAFVLFVYITLSSGIDFYKNNLNFSEVFYHCFRGMIAVAILTALSRYCYLLNNSFMKDSLKFGDRRHAISFGGLYLESFGAFADWSHVKDAFSNWNISSNNEPTPPVVETNTGHVSNADLLNLAKTLAEKVSLKS